MLATRSEESQLATALVVCGFHVGTMQSFENNCSMVLMWFIIRIKITKYSNYSMVGTLTQLKPTNSSTITTASSSTDKV